MLDVTTVALLFAAFTVAGAVRARVWPVSSVGTPAVVLKGVGITEGDTW
jgi:hypothetical protein